MRSPLFIVVLLMASAANADDGPRCRKDGTQQEMNACAVRDYTAADKALNETWQRVMKSLPSKERTQLRKQQREWIRMKEPRCKAETRAASGGSIWPLLYFRCLQTLTQQRTTELAALENSSHNASGNR